MAKKKARRLSRFMFPNGKRVHVLRNRQSEYFARLGHSVAVLEAYCGKKLPESDATEPDCDVLQFTCDGCVVAAAPRML